MGLLWTLPISAIQTACMYGLLRVKLKSAAPAKLRAFCGIGLFFCINIGLRVWRLPSYLDVGLYMCAAAVFAWILSNGPWTNVFLWGCMGSLAVFSAQAVSWLLIAQSGIVKSVDTPSSWPNLLCLLIETAALLILFILVCRGVQFGPELAPGIVSCLTVMTGLLAFGSGCAQRTIESAGEVQDAGNMVPLFVYIGCAGGIAFLTRHLSTSQAEKDERNRPRELFEPLVSWDRQWEFIRRWRHDEKQHLAVLTQLAREGRSEELTGYLEGLIGRLEMEDPCASTGDTYIDALLMEKRKVCQDANIEWRLLVGGLPETLPLIRTELVSILGNALDNAIESCRKVHSSDARPFVDVQLIEHQSMFKISIANTSNGITLSEKPSSSKGRRHGLGMQQIVRQTEGAGGFVRVKLLSHMFRLDIWLPKAGKTV